MKTKIALLSILLCVLFSEANADGDKADILTQRLAMRLIGTRLNSDNPKQKFYYAAVKELVEQGAYQNAALLLTKHQNFASETLRYFATADMRMLGWDERIDQFTSTEALYVLFGSQDINGGDFRQAFLTNKFAVIKHPDCAYNEMTQPNPYACARDKKLDLSSGDVLQLSDKTQDGFENALPAHQSAGIYTNGDTNEILNAGTNRRFFQLFVQNHMCLPLDSIRASRPASLDSLIRKDVERNTEQFTTQCRTCHTVLDPLSNAWAFIDPKNGNGGLSAFQTARLKTNVVTKMNQNQNVFPAGFFVTNDTWELNYTPSQTADWGHTGAISGTGVNSLMKSLIESDQFNRCMAEKVGRVVCPNRKFEKDELNQLAAKFKTNGYNLRKLFANVATLPQCLGQ